MRGADLKADGETTPEEIGGVLRGAPFGGTRAHGPVRAHHDGRRRPRRRGHRRHAGARKANGKPITFAAGQKTGQNVREAGEDLEGGLGRADAAAASPAPAGARAHRLAGHRRGRGRTGSFASRSSPPGDELKSDRHARSAKARSTTPTATRSTACSRASAARCSTWAWCATTRQLLERGVRRGGRERRRRDHQRRRLRGRGRFREGHARASSGEVVFWKIAMKPGRPLAYGKIGGGALLRPARQPRSR